MILDVLIRDVCDLSSTLLVTGTRNTRLLNYLSILHSCTMLVTCCRSDVMQPPATSQGRSPGRQQPLWPSTNDLMAQVLLSANWDRCKSGVVCWCFHVEMKIWLNADYVRINRHVTTGLEQLYTQLHSAQTLTSVD